MAGKQDRRETFTRLMTDHGAALKRLAAAYLADPAYREDLFQEIALAVWNGLPGFRGQASERTWLYRIAHNTAATQLHRLRRRRDYERQPAEQALEPADPSTPESAIHQTRRQERFVAGLRQLPTLDFQIVTMHLDGLPYAEIAAVVGLTQTNVGARLSRIRETLAAAVSSTENP